MNQVAWLVAGVIAVLLALEILNALFDSVVHAVARDGGAKTPAWAAPFMIVRQLLLRLAAIGQFTSLITQSFRTPPRSSRLALDRVSCF